MTTEQEVYNALEELKISYKRVDHAPADTIQDLAEVDRLLGVPHCKNLFLASSRSYYLLLLKSDKKFKTKEVSREIGSSRLSFGSAEALWETLGVLPGAVGPMGLLNDKNRVVNLLIDEDLNREQSLVVHPNVNTASIVMSFADFLNKFLRRTGHVPQFVKIGGAIQEL